MPAGERGLIDLDRPDVLRRVTLALVLAAIALRLSLWPYVTDDVTYFFGPWFRAFRDQGAWNGLASGLSDYTPPYLYVLASLSNLPLDALSAVKLMALATDAALLLSVLLLLRIGLRQPPARVLVGCALVAFLPTVVVNGALWGQSDAGWLALVLAALACALSAHPVWAMALLGVAVAVKLQAVFLVPAFAVLVLTRAVPLAATGAAAAGYLLPFAPAVLAGADPRIVYTVYAEQSATYGGLTLNAPNLWQLVPGAPDRLAVPAGAVTLAGVLLLVGVLAARKTQRSPVELLRLALLFALLCPYLLPRMHERYFFAADVLSVLLAVVAPARWWLPLLVVPASGLSYVPYLAGSGPVVPFPVLAVVMGLALAVVARDVVQAERQRGTS